MKKSFLIAVFLLLPASFNIYSQCCAAGNPVSSNCSIEEYGKNVLGVSLSHVYSMSDLYYNGINKLDKKYIETEFNFSYLSLNYGLSNKLRLLADIGYFYNKTQNFVTKDYIRKANGLGDLNLGLSFDTYKSDNKEFGITQTFRMTFPVGVFNQVYDGIELPIDLQPSSGNYKYNLGIMFSNRFGNSGFSVYSINTFEFAQFIKTSNSFYKYGNLYNLSLLGAYQFMPELDGRLQLRFEIRDKALNGLKTQDNQYNYINATGGVIAFLSPQVNYSLGKQFSVSAQFNLPVYKNVNSEQLTNKFSVQAGISKNFDFSGSKKTVDESELKADRDPNLLVTKIKVSGSCDMCKARIQETTNEFKNVSDSDWNEETQELSIYFKSEKPDITEIQKALASVGHDNEKFKAENYVYESLPKCCHYREKQK